MSFVYTSRDQRSCFLTGEDRDCLQPKEPNEEHVHLRWQSFGVVPGLSEADFMARQRYLQLTRLVLT